MMELPLAVRNSQLKAMQVKCGLDDGAVDDQVTKHDYCKTLFRHTRRIIVDSVNTYIVGHFAFQTECTM